MSISFRVARNKIITRVVTAVAAGATAMTLLAGAAQAQGAVPQARVGIEDLDLAKQRDAERLYSRLKYAADAVCSQFDGKEQYRITLKRACVQEALSDAVAQIDHANVTALHGSDRRIRLARE